MTRTHLLLFVPQNDEQLAGRVVLPERFRRNRADGMRKRSGPQRTRHSKTVRPEDAWQMRMHFRYKAQHVLDAMPFFLTHSRNDLTHVSHASIEKNVREVE